MAFDQLDTVPHDVFFQENALSMGVNQEKSAAPNLKETFAQASYGSTPLSPQAQASMGLSHILQPQEPIITPDQKPAYDTAALSVQGQCTGAFLQECKIGMPKGGDSFFGTFCTEFSNNLQGIAQALDGPQAEMPGMNPALQPQMQMAMRPGGLF
jgi:hypothetical protein